VLNRLRFASRPWTGLPYAGSMTFVEPRITIERRTTTSSSMHSGISWRRPRAKPKSSFRRWCLPSRQANAHKTKSPKCQSRKTSANCSLEEASEKESSVDGRTLRKACLLRLELRFPLRQSAFHTRGYWRAVRNSAKRVFAAFSASSFPRCAVPANRFSKSERMAIAFPGWADGLLSSYPP